MANLPRNDGGIWKPTEVDLGASFSPGPPESGSKKPKPATGFSLPVPFRERALIRVHEVAEKTRGGIIIPQTQQDRQWAKGEVLAVGEGQATVNGTFIPLPCRVGDTVQFNKVAATPVMAGEEVLWLVEDRDIQCKFPANPVAK